MAHGHGGRTGDLICTAHAHLLRVSCISKELRQALQDLHTRCLVKQQLPSPITARPQAAGHYGRSRSSLHSTLMPAALSDRWSDVPLSTATSTRQYLLMGCRLLGLRRPNGYVLAAAAGRSCRSSCRLHGWQQASNCGSLCRLSRLKRGCHILAGLRNPVRVGCSPDLGQEPHPLG